MVSKTIDETLDNLAGKFDQAREAYGSEMGAAKIRDFDPAAAVGVCMAHNGEFVICRTGGPDSIQIGAARYKPGDRVKLDATQKAAMANQFAQNHITPDYVYDTRVKHTAMRDHYNKAIEPALQAIQAAQKEAQTGAALEVAARAQLENALRMQGDGKAKLQEAYNQVLKALDYRPG